MALATRSTTSLRRLAALAVGLVLTTLSCSHDLTAPTSAKSRIARGLAFQTVFPSALSRGAVADVVPFDAVHIVFHHSDGTVALDTTVAYPAGADSLTLNLTITLLPDAPTTGEPLTLTLDYVNATGVTVFHGGPVTVIAAPGVQATAPVSVAVTYTGPGASATSVRISPRALAVFTGDPFAFTAVALDASNNVLSGTPVVWSSLDATATLSSDAAGSGLAGATRGTARIVAQLLTGPADTVRLTIQPKPSTIAAASGNTQVGQVAAALAQPVVARVTAADGGGVGGVVVTFAAANGGTVDSANVTTDSTGNASTHWTLGPTPGAQSLTATAAGLTGSPVTFTATADARAASQLAFTTSPGNVQAGVPFGEVVTARDSIGNVASGFVGSVTVALGANPGASTLGGTASATAVAGVATFSGLTLNKVDTGYTLVASAAGLTSATSSSFPVAAGAVAACTLVSGGGQTAVAGAALSPVTIMATDAPGNPVPNATLHVSVSSGGSVANASPVTDAQGDASIAWTLGATVGPQTISITCGAAALVVNATASSGSSTKLWTGATSSAWSVATNWSPSGVPAISDSVYVPAVTNQPALSAAVSVKSLVLAPAATLSLGANNLTLSGSLDAGNTILSSGGVVQLTGTGTMRGHAAGDVTVSGSYTLSGADTVSGNLIVSGTPTVPGSGQLVENGFKLVVGAAFSVVGSGTLTMTNAADAMNVAGNVTFSGGDETGKLTNGILTVGGNFSQAGATGSSFAASGSHLTVFGGAAQTISFVDASGASKFAILQLSSATSTTALTDVMADSAVMPTSAANFTAGVVTLRINRGLSDPNGHWRVPTTEFEGATPTLPAAMSGNVIFKGNPATLQSTSNVSGVLTVDTGELIMNGQTLTVASFITQNGGRVKMTQGTEHLNVGGNATFNGGDETGLMTNGVLALSGNFVQGTVATSFTAAPNFVTRFNGTSPTITFANPATSMFGKLELASSVGVSLSSNVTVAGAVWLQGGTVPSGVTGAADSVFIGADLYDSTGGRWQVGTTVMTGNGRVPRIMPHNLVFTNSNMLADSLLVSGQLSVAGASALLDLNGHYVWVGGNFSTASGGVLKMVSPNDSLIVGGNVAFNGGSTAGKLTNGYMEVQGTQFTQGTTAQSFSADGPHETNFVDGNPAVISHTITFANPSLANSHFGDVYFGDTLTVLGSDVYAGGELETGVSSTHRVTTATGDHRLATNGADVRNLTFDNTRWLLQGSDDINSMDDVTFQNISNTAATQFEWNRAGTGTKYTGLYGWAFYTPPTTGLYVKMTSSAPADTLQMQVNAPALNGGFIQALGGGAITGWPNTLSWTGAVNADFSNPSNWNVYAIPDSLTDVIIPAGTAPVLSQNSYVRNLTVLGSGVLAQANYNLQVHGNLATDTLVGGITCTGSDVSGITYQTAGPAATLQGRLCRYQSGRPITQTGLVTVSNVFHVGDSTYTLNSHKVVTQEAWVGTTLGSTGALKMIHPADSLIVSDSLIVGGNYGASQSAGVSTLTTGMVSVGGKFQVFGAPGAGYFNATPSLQTFLNGAGSSIAFTDTTASGFGTLTVNGLRTLAGVARVAGDFYLVGGSSLVGSAGRLKLTGTLWGGTSSSITTNAFELASLNSDSGTFSPDTAVYTGGGQLITDSLAAGLGTYIYKSIRVAGNATFAPATGGSLLTVNGKLIVTGAARIGNGSTFYVIVGDSLLTHGAGVVRMVDGASYLEVLGNAWFDGGSTSGLLTAGTLEFQKNFKQTATNSTLSYAPSSGHITKFALFNTDTVNFATPGTAGGGSHFGTLLTANTEPTVGVHLNSNVFVDGVLQMSAPAYDSVTFSGAGVTLTAQGALVSGGAAPLPRMVFNDVLFKLVDGATFTTFSGATFRNFGTSTAFEMARSSGTYTMTGLRWEGTASAGNFLNVSGAAPTVNVVTPYPGLSFWLLGLYFLNPTGIVNFLP